MRPEVIARFWAKVDRRSEDECWAWVASVAGGGYGHFAYQATPRKSMTAHRFAYVTTNGPVPAGLVLDHLCRNRRCCNPRHLEAVTNQVNVQRGRDLITHCPSGHPYSAENTYRPPNRNERVCRTCVNARRRERRNRRNTKGAAA